MVQQLLATKEKTVNEVEMEASNMKRWEEACRCTRLSGLNIFFNVKKLWPRVTFYDKNNTLRTVIWI